MALDQITKTWAESELADRTIDVVWTLRFHLTFNTGASFSLGDGFGPLIGIVALAVVGIVLWYGRSVSSRLGAIALGMIVGGALGNVMDRLFRGSGGFFGGAVVDFIDFQWWPVFNIADIGVVCGAILLMISMWRAPQDGVGGANTAAGSSTGGTTGSTI
ncbi:unannotated protein [freshwater metagenome]|uniref:Unannotated protein n=1 Tax=freshwater metagenome TaxID=449393 RepID=A0A6J6HZ05_9ZZZZ